MIDQIAEMFPPDSQMRCCKIIEDEKDEPGGQGVGDQKVLEETHTRADPGGQQQAHGYHTEMDKGLPVEVHSTV